LATSNLFYAQIHILRLEWYFFEKFKGTIAKYNALNLSLIHTPEKGCCLSGDNMVVKTVACYLEVKLLWFR